MRANTAQSPVLARKIPGITALNRRPAAKSRSKESPRPSTSVLGGSRSSVLTSASNVGAVRWRSATINGSGVNAPSISLRRALGVTRRRTAAPILRKHVDAFRELRQKRCVTDAKLAGDGDDLRWRRHFRSPTSDREGSAQADDRHE